MSTPPDPASDEIRRPLVTCSSLRSDLAAAGLEAGDVVLVHTSLSALGFVVGAQRTVIEALLEVVGPAGTVMMPTFSGELSDPAEWRYPPAPRAWHALIREETQAYDPVKTPTRRMGTVAELFRHYPGAIRSAHPQSSFTALGSRARELVGEHPLDFRFGPRSPLGALRDMGGKSLLLGAPPQTCSLYYLTQFEVGWQTPVTKRSPMLVDGAKRWIEYRDVQYPNAWFEDATRALVEAGIVTTSRVGGATCHILPARETIAAATEWRRRNGV